MFNLKGDKVMDERGQGALEYLLLIGGAVLVAAVVISLLSSLVHTQKNAAAEAAHRISNQYNVLAHA